MVTINEEKLTGALLSMTLQQPPMVVFVTSGGGPALGEQGRYNIVAQRLLNADFRVTQWNPAGQMSSMGQPTPPQPRPQAEPGPQDLLSGDSCSARCRDTLLLRRLLHGGTWLPRLRIAPTQEQAPGYCQLHALRDPGSPAEVP